MKGRLLWITIPASLLIIGAGWLLSAPAGFVRPDSANIVDVPRHPVTEEMWDKALARGGVDAQEIRLKTSNGEPFSLFDQLEKGPVVLVATKDGCPCSIESQPFFNQIQALYKGQVTFVGLIDADLPIAQLYKSGHEVAYPIVSATAKDPFLAYRFKQSVNLALISKDRKIKRVWPGYSASMLLTLNQAIADELKVPAKAMTLEHAPSNMTTGCYFFEDDPAMKAL